MEFFYFHFLQEYQEIFQNHTFLPLRETKRKFIESSESNTQNSLFFLK
jgi:hypothetical protein